MLPQCQAERSPCVQRMAHYSLDNWLVSSIVQAIRKQPLRWNDSIFILQLWIEMYICIPFRG